MEMLMGLETEYAVGGPNRSAVVEALVRAVSDTIPHLRSFNNRVPYDIFLSNGARFYIDNGEHPEWSTPECGDPAEVVRYALAGDEALARAWELLPGSLKAGPAQGIFKCNVDYQTLATWGSHESYLVVYPLPHLTAQLIPHLVSRVVFTGAGGFRPDGGGLRFTLSPRSWHIRVVVSECSTSSRGIIHSKDESLAGGGYRRLHIICGESLCSHLANWLRVGTTALVLAMIQAGLNPGLEVQLARPLKALRDFVSDPSLQKTACLQGGGVATALQIQRHYLQVAEANLDSVLMPRWASLLCWEWRRILDRLGTRPDSLAFTLDWATKLALFKDHVERSGFEWKDLKAWSPSLKRIDDEVHRRMRTASIPAGMISTSLGRRRLAEAVAALRSYLVARHLDSGQVGRMMKLRDELFEMDFRFGQVGREGIFSRLDAAGVLDHSAPGVTDVDRAIHTPPSSGRARLRGGAVEAMAGRKLVYCDWDRVVNIESRLRLDLSNPFAEDPRWVQISRDEKELVDVVRWLRMARMEEGGDGEI